MYQTDDVGTNDKRVSAFVCKFKRLIQSVCNDMAALVCPCTICGIPVYKMGHQWIADELLTELRAKASIHDKPLHPFRVYFSDIKAAIMIQNQEKRIVGIKFSVGKINATYATDATIVALVALVAHLTVFFLKKNRAAWRRRSSYFDRTTCGFQGTALPPPLSSRPIVGGPNRTVGTRSP